MTRCFAMMQMVCFCSSCTCQLLMQIRISQMRDDRNGHHWSRNCEGFFFVQQLFYQFYLEKFKRNRYVPRKYGKFFRFTVKMSKNIEKSLALLNITICSCRVQSNVFRQLMSLVSFSGCSFLCDISDFGACT